MTNTKTYKAVEELKKYIQRKDAQTYSSIMERAKRDCIFERMIQDMTINRINGGSSLKKNRNSF